MGLQGYIHQLESFGCADGPGSRFIIFFLLPPFQAEDRTHPRRIQKTIFHKRNTLLTDGEYPHTLQGIFSGDTHAFRPKKSRIRLTEEFQKFFSKSAEKAATWGVMMRFGREKRGESGGSGAP